jgi:hypothetical protein
MIFKQLAALSSGCGLGEGGTVMKTALWISGCLFAGLVGQNAVAAEFDTLTVKDNLKFNKTANTGETLTIDYGPVTIPLGPKENGRTFSSDVLVIPAFTIKLISDAGVGKTTIEPGAGLFIEAAALSDVSSFRSDSLSVDDMMGFKSSVFLKETDETESPFTFVPLVYPGKTIPLGPGENGNGPSDMLIIPSFTIMLGSDGGAGPDKGEPPAFWSIDITASSDTNAIPEPATWVMMLLGFAGLGFVGYRASRRGIELIA